MLFKPTQIYANDAYNLEIVDSEETTQKVTVEIYISSTNISLGKQIFDSAILEQSIKDLNYKRLKKGL